MIEQMGSGMGKPDPSPNLSLYFSPVNYLVVEMLDISVLSSTSKAINVIVHGQGRVDWLPLFQSQSGLLL